LNNSDWVDDHGFPRTSLEKKVVDGFVEVNEGLGVTGRFPKVVEAGDVQVGDAVEVRTRGTSATA